MTARAISALVERGGPLVAILWGATQAQSSRRCPATCRASSRPHPSARCPRAPASSARGPFSRANDLLAQPGRGTQSTGGSRDPARRRVPPGSGPATSRSATRSPRGCPTRPRPGHDGEFVGWADRLAPTSTPVAEREPCLRLRQPRRARPQARRRRRARSSRTRCRCSPTWCRIVGGGNDLLRPQVDLDGLAARLEEAVVRLRHDGADVLLATPTDTRDAGLVQGRCAAGTPCTPPTCSPSPSGTAAPCSTCGAWHALRDWRMWAEDRIHLTTRGPPPGRAGRARPRSGTAPTWPTGPPRWPAGRPGRREALRGHAAVGPHVRRPVGAPPPHGRSSGDQRQAKRPDVTPLDQP